MSDFSRRIAELSPEKRALLARRREKALSSIRLGQEGGAQTRPIPRRKDFSPAPLSVAQEDEWARVQAKPDEPWTCVFAVRINGPFHAGALERSLNEIVRRHEALRTTFVTDGGSPAQVISPELKLGLPVEDLSGLAEAEREAELQRIILEKMRQRFDLERGPLLQATLYRLGVDEHAMLLSRHHAIMDGWSSGVLLREVLLLYTAFSSGSPSPLPELPIQSADYACWQRQWLEGEEARAHLDYWRRKLEGATPITNLPYDRPRPDGHRVSPSEGRSLTLPPTLSEAVSDLSRREGVTLFTTTMAAFLALLYRLTGQDDLCVATFTASRTRGETEPLLGVFWNTLLLRTKVPGDLTFRELLGRVSETMLEANAHQEVPFPKVAETLQLGYDPGRAHPLTQVHCRYASSAMVGVGSKLRHDTKSAKGLNMSLPSGLTFSRIDYDYTGSQSNDLTLYVQDNPDGICLSFDYATDWFDPPTIDRMLRQLNSFLDAAVSDPVRRLSTLPL